MDIDTTIRRFSELSEHQQAIILTRFAYELTILARKTYPAEGEPDSTSMTARDINELQHRVTAAIVARLLADPQRFPDDVLVRMCSDPTDNPLALSSGPVLSRLLEESNT